MRLPTMFIACTLVLGLSAAARAERAAVYKTAAEAARATGAQKLNHAPFWARRGLDVVDATSCDDKGIIDKSGKTEKHLVVTKAMKDDKPVGRVQVTVRRTARGWIAEADGAADMVVNGHRFGDGCPAAK